MPKHLKHIIHVVALYSWLSWTFYDIFTQPLPGNNYDNVGANETIITHAASAHLDRSETYTIFWRIFSYLMLIIQYWVFLPFPQVFANVLGLTFFNAFPGEIQLETSPADERAETRGEGIETTGPALGNGNGVYGPQVDLRTNSLAEPTSNFPHLCFRVVTRGNYPELVQSNVHKNFLTCAEAGLTNFSFEVVTDQDVHIQNDPRDSRVRQLVVPANYKTATGAMFKARALQYALEPGVSPLKRGDYIVHLDEETIISRNVVNGICNFALRGKYDFGQGLITYANLNVVNILTTMADSYRVADDMGKMQFQLGALHKPIFGWKGSFVVTKYEAELDVSYDHGPDGSIAEDCYFSMVAINKGYKFDFIQGEMYEKSPFTVLDFIKQRKRWIQGIWLVVHNCKIPLRTKIFLIFSHYASLTLPVVTVNVAVNLAFRLPAPIVPLIVGKFCASVTFYMYIFGLIKTYDLRPRSVPILILHLIIQVATLTFNAVIENVAVIWGIFSPKHNFYVVKKDLDGKVIFDS